MTVRSLSPDRYGVLETFVSPGPRNPWVAEAEDFLVLLAPSGYGDARGSTIVMIDIEDHFNVAAAVFRSRDGWNATNVQAFVVRPLLRGTGLSQPAFTELRDFLITTAETPDYVMWSVREQNTPMLSISDRVGDRAGVSEGFVRYNAP